MLADKAQLLLSVELVSMSSAHRPAAVAEAPEQGPQHGAHVGLHRCALDLERQLRHAGARRLPLVGAARARLPAAERHHLCVTTTATVSPAHARPLQAPLGSNAPAVAQPREHNSAAPH
jgi:hypothetical protein